MTGIGLRTKMLLLICGIIVISYIITISYVYQKAAEIAETESLARTVEMSKRYGYIVATELELAMNTCRTMAKVLEGSIRNPDDISREAINNQLMEILQSNPLFFGFWASFEPNQLDGKDAYYAEKYKRRYGKDGRFTRYFWINEGKATGAYDNSFEKPWYSVPKKRNKEFVLDPIWGERENDEVKVTMGVPVQRDGRFIGTVGVCMRLTSFQKLVGEIRPFGVGYGFLVANNGKIVTHPNRNNIGKNITDLGYGKSLIESIQKGKDAEVLVTSESGEISYQIFHPIDIGETQTPWSFAISVPREKILENARALRNKSILICVLSLLVLTLAIIFIVQRYIITPTKNVVENLKDIAQGEGDLTQRLEVQGKDEIGELSIWFNMFTDNLQKIIGELASNSEDMQKSATDLLQISKDLEQGSRQTSDKANSVTATSTEINTNVNSVASAMEQATENSNLVSVSTEQMNATINEIVKSTEKTRIITQNAVTQAEKISQMINELSESTKDINKVTETINEISDQTNLLALNATIEAARAGEAGKGFAVVANEIKELANQTALATKEIKEKIDGVQGITFNTIERIKEINQVITDIDDFVSGVATAIEEQSVAINEIARNIAQVTLGISEVNNSIAFSSKAIEGITSDMAEVNQSAQEIAQNSYHVHFSAENQKNLADKSQKILGKFKI